MGSGVIAVRSLWRLLPPADAGLSHMSQRPDEIIFAPSGFEAFYARGGFVGHASENVGGQAPQQSQVSRPLILARAREILVEHHILLPMAAVLDVPVAADHLHQLQ